MVQGVHWPNQEIPLFIRTIAQTRLFIQSLAISVHHVITNSAVRPFWYVLLVPTYSTFKYVSQCFKESVISSCNKPHRLFGFKYTWSGYETARWRCVCTETCQGNDTVIMLSVSNRVYSLVEERQTAGRRTLWTTSKNVVTDLLTWYWGRPSADCRGHTWVLRPSPDHFHIVFWTQVDHWALRAGFVVYEIAAVLFPLAPRRVFSPLHACTIDDTWSNTESIIRKTAKTNAAVVCG